MNRIKALAFSLLALLLLLSGCTAVPSGTPSTETDVPEDMTTVAEPTLSDPASVITGDHPCDIYFVTGNNYYDFYNNYSAAIGLDMLMLTREYIDPNDISVSIDIQTGYSVRVTPPLSYEKSLVAYETGVNENGVWNVSVEESTGEEFPLYIYQNYAGMDWRGLTQARHALHAVGEQVNAGTLDAAEWPEALSAYNRTAAAYLSDYMNLTAEDVPDYYVYFIFINFDEATVDEICEAVEITVGDTVYDVDIGRVRLRPSPPFGDLESAYRYVSTAQGGDYGMTSYPYGPGIEKYGSDVWLAEEPVTLTGLTFLEDSLSTLELLDVEVVICDSLDEAVPGSTGMTVSWDGKTPLFVEQGKYFSLYFTVHDERLKEIAYGAQLYPVLEFTCDGGTFEVNLYPVLCRSWSADWLLYAICLDGQSFESYFDDYYRQIYDTWRNDIDITDTWESRRQANAG